MEHYACISLLILIVDIESCKTPNEVWITLENLFGKQDTMRGFKLENELICLNLTDFASV